MSSCGPDPRHPLEPYDLLAFHPGHPSQRWLPRMLTQQLALGCRW